MSELYHYGIPGMKWGVRRYQNPDGSLTALGMKRLNAEKTAIGEYYRKVKPDDGYHQNAMNKLNRAVSRANKVRKTIDRDAYRKHVLGEEKANQYKQARQRLDDADKDLQNDPRLIEKMARNMATREGKHNNYSRQQIETRVKDILANYGRSPDDTVNVYEEYLSSPKYKEAKAIVDRYYEEIREMPYRSLLTEYD